MSHATNMHGHLNTNRVWMGRRECAAQQQGDKKSILMNIPTRQCLRKRKRDKTEPSFQEHRVSVQKQRNGSIAEDTKQRWNFITPSWIAASWLCTRMQATNNSLPLFADVSLQFDPNRRQLVNLPREFSKLVRLQDTLLVPFCSTSSS